MANIILCLLLGLHASLVLSEIGDVCGSPPNDCPALRCACATCPDGINNFGCCGECYEGINGTCGGILLESTCPQINDTCTGCIAPNCPCGLCSDGINSFGCCDGCIIDENYACVAAPIKTCPITQKPGDSCTGCIAPQCPCGICPDGNTTFGCCGGCILDDNLDCVAEPIQIQSRSDCPQVGDTCGIPNIDCPGLRCPCNTCPDGVNEWGCCSDCILNDNFECTHPKPESLCPSVNVGDTCGVPNIDCPGQRCPCNKCPDGINEWGCCSDCIINDNLNCIHFKPESSCPSIGDTCGVPGTDCKPKDCDCNTCPDGINTYGCCGECYINNKFKCKARKPRKACPPTKKSSLNKKLRKIFRKARLSLWP